MNNPYEIPEKELAAEVAILMPTKFRRAIDVANRDFYSDSNGKIFEPLENTGQFAEIFKDPATAAKVMDVLDEWFTMPTPYDNPDAVIPWATTPFWHNPTYQKEQGGQFAWWLRALIQVLRNEK